MTTNMISNVVNLFRSPADSDVYSELVATETVLARTAQWFHNNHDGHCTGVFAKNAKGLSTSIVHPDPNDPPVFFSMTGRVEFELYRLIYSGSVNAKQAHTVLTNCRKMFLEAIKTHHDMYTPSVGYFNDTAKMLDIIDVIERSLNHVQDVLELMREDNNAY